MREDWLTAELRMPFKAGKKVSGSGSVPGSRGCAPTAGKTAQIKRVPRARRRWVRGMGKTEGIV